MDLKGDNLKFKLFGGVKNFMGLNFLGCANLERNACAIGKRECMSMRYLNLKESAMHCCTKPKTT